MASISRTAALCALALSTLACGGGGRAGGPGSLSKVGGRETPRQALSAFLAAARAKDVDAMALVWGSDRGAAASYMDRVEREKRILVIQCHLTHDREQVISEFPGENGRRGYRVALSLGATTLETTLLAVQGPEARWFIESVDIEKTSDLCRQTGLGKPAKPPR